MWVLTRDSGDEKERYRFRHVLQVGSTVLTDHLEIRREGKGKNVRDSLFEQVRGR